MSPCINTSNQTCKDVDTINEFIEDFDLEIFIDNISYGYDNEDN